MIVCCMAATRASQVRDTKARLNILILNAYFLDFLVFTIYIFTNKIFTDSFIMYLSLYVNIC